jgi:photosystem II stability/assembly factor-like uncharacterized protein
MLMLLCLVLAILACVPPWNTTPNPEPPDETEPVTPTVTAAVTPTPTEEPVPELPLFSNPELFRLEMFTADQGWAVTRDQNHLLRTEDGGQTWLEATPRDMDPGEHTTLGISPEFLDTDTVWFTPNSAPPTNLYHSTDGGASWQITPVPFDNARYEFLDLNNGYALVALGAGAGSHYVALYQTTDSGSSWTEVFSHEPGESKSLPNGGYKNGVTFLDMNHGWIGGGIPMTDHLYLYATEDGGATWQQETDIAIDEMFAGFMFEVWQPVFLTDTLGYLPVQAMAPEGWSNLLFYKSTDAGQSWTFQNFTDPLRDFSFTSPETLWGAARFNLLRGTDSAVVWFAPETSGIPDGEFFLKVDFVDENNGWVLTTPNDDTWDPVKLYRTTDGGASWMLLTP